MHSSRNALAYIGILVGVMSFNSAVATAQGGRGGVQIQPGESCPEGMTEVRPQSCRAPELPLPSIVDYRPQSTLITEEHLRPGQSILSSMSMGTPDRLLIRA